MYERTLHGTLMDTGMVRDAQQKKQYVYNILCDSADVTPAKQANL
jgi:hypothetical protein